LSNVPGSVAQLAKDTAYPFLNPVETAKALPALFSGEGLEALKGHYTDRYGSVEKAMRTAYKDPAGFMSDLSVGGLLRRPLKNVPGLNKLTEAADLVDPVNLARLTAKAPAAVAGAVGKDRQLYRNLLRMSNAKGSKYRLPEVQDRVVDTLLSRNIPINAKGIRMMQDAVGSAADELDNIIDAADQAGRQIPTHMFARRLNVMRREIANRKAYPEKSAELAAIDGYLENWRDEIGDLRFISPSEARTTRQAIDAKVDWTKLPGSVEEAQGIQIRKQAAHGVREALAEGVPEARGPTRDISNLLEANEPLEVAAARLGKNNAVPLDATIRQTAGIGTSAIGVGSGNLPAIIAGIYEIIRAHGSKPNAKGIIARHIYNNKDIPNAAKRTLLQQLATQAPQQIGRAVNPDEGQQ
jgi:hypothetical protein